MLLSEVLESQERATINDSAVPTARNPKGRKFPKSQRLPGATPMPLMKPQEMLPMQARVQARIEASDCFGEPKEHLNIYY